MTVSSEQRDCGNRCQSGIELPVEGKQYYPASRTLTQHSPMGASPTGNHTHPETITHCKGGGRGEGHFRLEMGKTVPFVAIQYMYSRAQYAICITVCLTVVLFQ